MVDEDTVRAIVRSGPLLAVDTADILAVPREPVDVVGAVPIAHPDVTVAPESLLVYRNGCGGVACVLVDGKGRRLQPHDHFAVQCRLEHLAGRIACARRIFVAVNVVSLGAVVRYPQELDPALVDQSDPMRVRKVAAPRGYQVPFTVEGHHFRVAGVAGYDVSRLCYHDARMRPSLAGAVALGNLGPVVDPIV